MPNLWDNDPIVTETPDTPLWANDPVIDPEIPQTSEDQSAWREVADIPLQLGKGTATGVRMFADAFGSGNPVSQAVSGVENYLDSLLSAQSKQDSAEVARIIDEAKDKGVLDQVKAGLKAISVAPLDFTANAAGTALPIIAGTLLAPEAAIPAVGLGLGAVMGAGTVKNAISQAVHDELVKQGVPEAAAQSAADEAQAYKGENLDQIALGTLLGSWAARSGVEPALAALVSRKAVSEATEALAKKGMAQRVVTGAVSEAVPEGIQGAQEQVARNIALQNQGVDIPTMQGVVGQGTLEGGAGLILGGSIGGVHSRPQTSVQPVTEPDVQPVIEPAIQPEVQSEVQPDVQDEIQPDVQDEIQDELQPETPPATEPDAPTAITPPVAPITTFSNPPIEERYQEARKGLGDQRAMTQRFSDFMQHTWHGFTRRHIDLPNEARFALANETLRQYEASPQVAQQDAIRHLENITKNLDASEYDVFTRKVILDDLAYEADINHDLPFGFTPETLAKNKAAIDDRIAKNPKLQQSLNYRQALQNQIRTDLVEAGILSEEQVQNKSYFHHQILTYALMRQQAQGRAGKLKKSKSGYAKHRRGSFEDPNANYLEAEFEFLHRAMIDLKAVEAIKKIGQVYDIAPVLRERARALSKQTGAKIDWREQVPEGMQIWQPDKGNIFYTGLSIPEQAVNRLLDKIQASDFNGTVSADALQEVLASVRKTTMLGGKKMEMVLPVELAATLDNMRPDVDAGLFDHALATPLKWWKQWVLINPRRVLKYNINNISGDADAVIAGNPKVLKKLPAAIKELYQVMQGAEPSARYREAVQRGVFDAGLTLQEIPDINLMDPFQHVIEQPGLNEPGKFVASKLYGVWKKLRDYTRFRENWLRYAAYLDYVERLEAGESVESIGYGASNPVMVDEILADNIQNGAALLARDLVGDYGDVSAFGQGIRKKVIPFYSWMEVNTRRYMRLINNAYAQGVGKGLATTGVLGAALGARTTAYLGLRMATLYALIQMWNNMVMGDEEDELSAASRVRLHLNLGKDKNGVVRTLRFQGALSDFLQWFGAEDAVASFLEIEKGRASWKDVAKSVAKGAPNKITSGLTPMIKLPFELASGLSFYPDMFNPQPIKDKVQHTARLFSMENEYDWLTGRPSRGYAHSLDTTIFSKQDAGEMAYNKIRGMAYQFRNESQGAEGYSTMSTPRSKALRDYRDAKRYRDTEAEARARKKLKELHVSPRDIAQSIKRAHPLGSIPKKDRSKFMRTLTPKERNTLQRAIKWYQESYH